MMAEKKVFVNVKCRRNFQMMGDQQVEKYLPVLGAFGVCSESMII